MTYSRSSLRRALAIALAALAFVLGLAVGVASTPTTVRQTLVYCDGEPLTLESREWLVGLPR